MGEEKPERSVYVDMGMRRGARGENGQMGHEEEGGGWKRTTENSAGSFCQWRSFGIASLCFSSSASARYERGSTTAGRDSSNARTDGPAKL